MYRLGHGDCFLLAFPGTKKRPFYVLIDCGYKPGSNVRYNLSDIETVVADIAEATGKHIDLMIITHEHQDHVNGIWSGDKSRFDSFKIGEAWFAWTEDEIDPLAQALRDRHHDQLLGLVAARNSLAAAGGGETLQRVDDLLSLELGVDDAAEFAAVAKNPERSINKRAMRFVRQKAERGAKCIRPHEEILTLPGVKGVRVFALGPPHNADLLYDEDPQGNEAFPGHGFSATAMGSFFAAAQAGDDKRRIRPFGRRYGISVETAFKDDEYGPFFSKHYGAADVASGASASITGTGGTSTSRKKPGANQKAADDSAGSSPGAAGSAITPAPRPDAAAGNASETSSGNVASDEVAGDAPFRRIETDWLYSAEDLALVLNKGINNTSLVLAFELERSGRVLLFVGDAQRGNWVSWTNGSWTDDKGKRIGVRDLLARCCTRLAITAAIMRL
jgi:hypothetical protein